MTQRNRRRFGRLTCGVLVAAALVPQAAHAVDLKPQVIAPLPADFNRSYLPSVRTSQALLRPDGRVAWPIGADETSLYGRGVWMQGVDVLAERPQWTTVFANGSERLGPGSSGYYSTLAAYRGADWMVSQPERAPEATESNLIIATSTLMAFDDQGAVVKKVALPVRGKFARAIALLPGGRGLRIAMLSISDQGNTVYLADERGRVRTELPQINETIAGVALADGSLVIAGWTADPKRATRIPITLLRVSSSGRVTPIDAASRRQPPRALGGLAPAFGGVVTTTGLSGATNSRVHLIRGARTVKSIAASTLRFPRSPECLASKEHWISANAVLTGPSGQPIVLAACNEEGDRGERVLQRVVLGIDRQLRVRWHADAASFTPALVGPDGRMLQVGQTGVVAAEEPDALQPSRGALLRLTRSGDAAATATIRCQRAYGAVCNGRIVIRSGGRTLGSAIYAAPGRPGRAAATIRRTVELSAPSSGRLTAQLVPLAR